VEDFSDLSKGLVNDLTIQRKLVEMLGNHALLRRCNTIYVIFLAPGITSTLGASKAGIDYAAYHNSLHLDTSEVRYVWFHTKKMLTGITQRRRRPLLIRLSIPPVAPTDSRPQSRDNCSRSRTELRGLYCAPQEWIEHAPYSLELGFAKILCAPENRAIPGRDGCPVQVIPAPSSAKNLSQKNARTVCLYEYRSTYRVPIGRKHAGGRPLAISDK